MIYKTLHRKLKIEQHEQHWKQYNDLLYTRQKLKIEQHEQHWKQYNDMLYTRQKTKDRATRTALKTIQWSTKH